VRREKFKQKLGAGRKVLHLGGGGRDLKFERNSKKALQNYESHTGRIRVGGKSQYFKNRT